MQNPPQDFVNSPWTITILGGIIAGVVSGMILRSTKKVDMTNAREALAIIFVALVFVFMLCVYAGTMALFTLVLFNIALQGIGYTALNDQAGTQLFSVSTMTHGISIIIIGLVFKWLPNLIETIYSDIREWIND